MRYVALVQVTYDIDRAKYGLPCGPDDPAYSANKWPLSKCFAHSKEALRAFGPHVGNLFAVGVGDVADGGSMFGRLAAGDYIGTAIEACADFDFVGSFKRMAVDGSLRRLGPTGLGQVYVSDKDDAARVDGIENYYAGQLDTIMKLWWAMLCENTIPFAALHDKIAAVLQRTVPAASPKP